MLFRSRLELKVAETREELEACFTILHDAYVASGFMKPDPSGMRVTIYHALPTTTTLCAKWEGRVVGTISMIREGVFGVIDPNVARIITIEGATGDSAIYERQGVSSWSVTHGRTKTHHVVEDINALPLTQPRRDGAYNGNLARVDCSTAVD